MNIVAIIQARMGSTRLPGKVMRQLEGRTVLSHVIERIKRVPAVDQIVIATTVRQEDDLIVKEAIQCDAGWYRGSEADVLSRYKGAALEYNADTIVRITSDCPLLDPGVTQRVIEAYLSADADYCSNFVTRTFPRGLETEVFSVQALLSADEHAIESYEREHVTPYIYGHPEQFSLRGVTSETDESRYRWTLDTPEDWELISAIFAHLYHGNPLFTWHDVLHFMYLHPELERLNAHIEQKKLGE